MAEYGVREILRTRWQLAFKTAWQSYFCLAPSLPLVDSERKNRKWAWKGLEKENALSGLLSFTSFFLTRTHTHTRKFTRNLPTYTLHITHSTHAGTYIHSICGDSCVASTYCDAASLTTPAPAS